MLKGGGDELGQFVDARGGQGADGEDLGGDHQAEQVGDGGGDIDLGHVQRRRDSGQQHAVGQTTEKSRIIAIGDSASQYGLQRGTGVLVAPGRDEGMSEPSGELRSRSGGKQFGDDADWVQRPVQRREEQLILSSEVVVDQGGIHLGRGGNGTNRCAGVAPLRELGPRRVQNVAGGACRPGPATSGGHQPPPPEDEFAVGCRRPLDLNT
jgi:hypothetical protein